jgi:mannosyl-3-phosphoglycerate phosphatase
MTNPVIFTDLDGTLLDYTTYSFEKALPALALIEQKKVPLVICSSKTRKEIEYYRKRLDNYHPFISENGGGIYMPKDYFIFPAGSDKLKVREENSYRVIRLGARYSDLRKVIETLREEGFKVKGFGDMTAEELSGVADMSIYEAEMAMERDFDEPFIFEGNEAEARRLFERIRSEGFNITQGRFFHILGQSDKGKAVSILTEFYRRKLGEITTIAVGDSPNDIPMLENVDHPVIVRKPDGTYDPRIALPGLEESDGIGPDGWNRAVLAVLALFEPGQSKSF